MPVVISPKIRTTFALPLLQSLSKLCVVHISDHSLSAAFTPRRENPNAPTFDVLTSPTGEQQRALNLLGAIVV